MTSIEKTTMNEDVSPIEHGDFSWPCELLGMGVFLISLPMYRHAATSISPSSSNESADMIANLGSVQGLLLVPLKGGR